MTSSPLLTEKTKTITMIKMIKTSIGEISKEDFIQKANEGTLPENIHVEGYLNLDECPSLRALPKGLQVEAWLDLSGCTSLTTLPEGLQVGIWLKLRYCTSLSVLPKDLIVGWSLYLERCTSLTELPEGLQVGHTIYADKSLIQNYPFKQLPKILHLPFDEYLKQLLLERLK